MLTGVLKDGKHEKMYICGMKKTTAVLLLILALAAFLFANGTPEEQQLFFQNLMNNTQTQSQAPTRSNSSGVTMSSSRGSSYTTGSEKISRDMATLERLYQYVNQNFLYDIDYDAVYEALATALFEALGDKYTYYVTAEESDDYAEEVSGTYGGLGIYFSKTYVDYQDIEDESTLYAVITQVFPGTPAARGGLKAGDYIMEIDGQSVVDMEATDCARLMKGSVGSSVELTIKRKESVFKLKLTREMITVPTVEYSMIEGKTAYLRILEFSSSTTQSIGEALTDLANQGMEKLIIDLRDNPGGDVDATLEIANMFVKGSKLLSVSYKDTSRNVTYVATDKLLVDEDVEVAILVNGGTASSAEIFTAALKDTGRASVFGTTTYGKGVMQVISSFGTGYTSVTTANFVGPSGDTIHGVGVEPDHPVEELYVEDDELDAYTELLETNAAAAFVDAHPEYNDMNINAFAEQYASTGIRAEVLRVVVRNEYLSRLDADEVPLVDVVYDPVAKAAYEVLRSYENEVENDTQGTSVRVVNF